MNLVFSTSVWAVFLMLKPSVSYQGISQSATPARWDHYPKRDPPVLNHHNRRWANGTSSIPSPCTTNGFNNPVYEISSPNLVVHQPRYTSDIPEREFNFRLRDLANNYTLNCTWGPVDSVYQTYWYSSKCIPEDGSEFDVFTHRNLLKMLVGYQPVKVNLSISQIWVCEPKNNAYPLLYEAEARVSFNTSCPSGSIPPNTTAQCNITAEAFPITTKATWRPPVHSTGLIPRPVAAPARSDHPSALPSKDCTDMSFTHPDLVIDDFYYVPSASSLESNMTAQDFNFTVTNYATGARAFCQTSHSFSYVLRGVGVDCSTILAPQNDSFLSNSSSKSGLFMLDSHELWISEVWTCGDTSGNHSTTFETQAHVVVPLYCTTDGGKICRAGRTVAPGRLSRPVSLTPAPIPLPPNTDVNGCTSMSTSSPGWTVRKLLYQRTHVSGFLVPFSADYYSRSFEIELVNNVNGYVQACTITDSKLDGHNEAWFRCFPEPKHNFPQYLVETWVQFDVTTQRLAVNQTWYCNDTQTQIGTPLGFTALGSITLSTSVISGALCAWTNTSTHAECYIPFFGERSCDPRWEVQWCNGSMSRFGLTISGTISRQAQLPANAFTMPDPDPTSNSCTVASAGRDVIWRFRNWEFRTFWSDRSLPNETLSRLTMDLASSALGGEVVPLFDAKYRTITPYLPGSDPGAVMVGTRKSVHALGYSMRFDPVTMYMELNQSWYCEDKDPSRPIIFNGTWNGYVPMNCSIARGSGDHRWNDNIYCGLAVGDMAVLPVVTWYTSDNTIPDR